MMEEHSSSQYDIDLEMIRSKLWLMGGMVEDQFHDAIYAYRDGNAVRAHQVVAKDEKVNSLELSLDEDCAHVIVRRQPAAADLRLVMAALKVVTDIERVGDEAVKIARIAANTQERLVNDELIRHSVMLMARSAAKLFHDARDAFARMEEAAAASILARDREIDDEARSMLRTMITYMMEDPRSVAAALDALWVSRAIERIGDHAKNIAEYVIYVVEGRDIRHTQYVYATLASDKPA